MNRNQKGALLAVAAATLLASGFMAPVAHAKSHMVRCQLSGGDGDGNTCSNGNGCPAAKSSHIESMTREECHKEGGKVVK